MSGPPLKLDVDQSVTPSAVHTPIPVPIHWQKEVKAQLEEKVRMLESELGTTQVRWVLKLI